MSAISTFLKNRRCAKIRSLLSAYIDGETSASESRRVQEHLASCPGCAAELESLRATTMLLGRLPQLEPPRSYTLTPAQAAEATNRRTLPFPAFEKFTGGLVTAGAASLVVALVVGLVFLARLGIIGLADEALPAPAAAPAAPVQQMAAPAAAAPAAPAQQMAAPAAPAPAAPTAPALAPTVAPAPAAAMAAPAPAATMPQAAPAPTTAPAAAAPAPAAAAHTDTEQEIVKETAMELVAIDDANVEDTADMETQASPETVPEPTPTYAVKVRVGIHADYVSTPTNEATASARATHEAQAAATVTAAANEVRAKYATVLAQWEADQMERAEEQAKKRRAIEATYEAQLSESYAAATARANAAVREATAKAMEVQAVEVQATEQSAPSEATIPVWALVMIGVAALAAAAATAFGLMRRRARNNGDEQNEQDGNH